MHKLPLGKGTLSMMYVNIKSCLMDHILIRTAMGSTLAETILYYVYGCMDIHILYTYLAG